MPGIQEALQGFLAAKQQQADRDFKQRQMDQQLNQQNREYGLQLKEKGFKNSDNGQLEYDPDVLAQQAKIRDQQSRIALAEKLLPASLNYQSEMGTAPQFGKGINDLMGDYLPGQNQPAGLIKPPKKSGLIDTNRLSNSGDQLSVPSGVESTNTPSSSGVPSDFVPKYKMREQEYRKKNIDIQKEQEALDLAREKKTPEGMIKYGPESVKADMAAVKDINDNLNGLEGYINKGVFPSVVKKSDLQGVPLIGKGLASLKSDTPQDILYNTIRQQMYKQFQNRFNLDELHQLEQLLPQAGDSKEAAHFKIGLFRTQLANKVKATSGQVGPQDLMSGGNQSGGGMLNQPRSVTPQDQQAISWAQSNSNDPRAKKILQLHGM